MDRKPLHLFFKERFFTMNNKYNTINNSHLNLNKTRESLSSITYKHDKMLLSKYPAFTGRQVTLTMKLRSEPCHTQFGAWRIFMWNLAINILRFSFHLSRSVLNDKWRCILSFGEVHWIFMYLHRYFWIENPIIMYHKTEDVESWLYGWRKCFSSREI